MDRMEILAQYTLSEDNRNALCLRLGSPFEGENVKEWLITDDVPTLADIAKAAFADHMSRNA